VFALIATLFCLAQGTAMFALIATFFARFGTKDVYEDYLAQSANHDELETRLRHIDRAGSASW
jgi:hypothetical protein